jgi:hypothetical protein
MVAWQNKIWWCSHDRRQRHRSVPFACYSTYSYCQFGVAHQINSGEENKSQSRKHAAESGKPSSHESGNGTGKEKAVACTPHHPQLGFVLYICRVSLGPTNTKCTHHFLPLTPPSHALFIVNRRERQSCGHKLWQGHHCVPAEITWSNNKMLEPNGGCWKNACEWYDRLQTSVNM